MDSNNGASAGTQILGSGAAVIADSSAMPSSQGNSSSSPFKRSQLGVHIRDFQKRLGKDWELYHETLLLFLVGKLSRTEMVDTIRPILPKGLYRYHNKLLLLNLANSLKDPLAEYANEFASFWNKRTSKASKVRLSLYDGFKQNIMALPLKERRRIKNITRDSGKRGKLSAGITLTRHALLPKIPMIQDKEQQQLQVQNLVQWQQDVVNGISTPICSESHELPDRSTLQLRVTMIMREHGLTGHVSGNALEVLMLGLEAHLKNILDSAIDVAKYRENKYTNTDYLPSTFQLAIGTVSRQCGEIQGLASKDSTLCIEDMYDTLQMFPHLIESNGAALRLDSLMLTNDDEAPAPYTSNGRITKAEDIKPVAAAGPAQTLNGQGQRPESYIGTTEELKGLVGELVSAI